MARVIKAAVHHNCHIELKQLDEENPELYIGSIAECSCGRQFKKLDSQRDGIYWSAMKKWEYVTPEEPPAPFTTYNPA